jgi:hypothetical protein
VPFSVLSHYDIIKTDRRSFRGKARKHDSG